MFQSPHSFAMLIRMCLAILGCVRYVLLLAHQFAILSICLIDVPQVTSCNSTIGIILFAIQLATLVCHAASGVLVLTTILTQFDPVLFLILAMLLFTSFTNQDVGMLIPLIMKLF